MSDLVDRLHEASISKHCAPGDMQRAAERIQELEDANKDKAQLLARCFAEKKKLEATLAYLAEEAANPNDRVIAKKGLKDKNNVL